MQQAKPLTSLSIALLEADCHFNPGVLKRGNFSQLELYLTEIKIGYACKLLFTKRYSIAEVAYESGFENLPNFNKQFLKLKKKTPEKISCQTYEELLFAA